MNRATRLTTFAVCTLAWSYLFLVIRPLEALPFEVPFFLTPFLGLFSPLGGLLCALVLRRSLPEDRPTMFGGQPARTALILAPIPICLAVLGLDVGGTWNPHAMGAWMGVAVLAYALVEEWGWRGYLREDVGIDNLFLNALAVTALWYPWHWWFLSDTASVTSEVVKFASLFGASLGIGKISEMTRSVTACAAFHAIGNVLIMTPVIAGRLSGGEKIAVLVVCVTTWVAVLRSWPKDP